MDTNMIFKEETGIKSSNVDRVEEALIEGTKLMEDANMSRAKVKMEEVREENARLKLTLSQMMENYHSLKMQFSGVTRQSNKPTNLAPMAASEDEFDFVSLSLGRSSADSKSEEIKKKNNSFNETKNQNGIELGLNWKLQSDKSCAISRILRPENGFDESIEEGSESRRSPKISRDIGDDEILHNPMKKTRVSVRTVCSTQTMHDGCQWRKYGQKISKGNPCPRAYYRCTVASSCPVRKQVQRCIDDMSILVTTYEGIHSHPLPPSAATMASATSAAAAMLSCGSSTSPPSLGVSATSSTSPSLFGFNFPSNNFPRATISTSQSHPTVVLDLTTRFSSTLISAKHSAPTSLNFSSFDPQIGWETKFPTINDVASSAYLRPLLLPDIHKQAVNDRNIAAATKAITHDPNFQSALAAAITSFVGNSNSVGRNSSGVNFGLNFSQPSMRKT